MAKRPPPGKPADNDTTVPGQRLEDAPTLLSDRATRTRAGSVPGPGQTASGNDKSAGMADATGYDRYESRGELGRGGMGVVEVVWDRNVRREVALKRMLKHDSAAVSRFVHEAQVTGQLEHPNIITVHELGRTPDGSPFFTMKLVRGESLKQRIDAVRDRLRKGDTSAAAAFPIAERLAVVVKIGEARACAHDHGVIHRDLKPENVMVGRYGEVQVMDWGLARVQGDVGNGPVLRRTIDDLPRVQSDRTADATARTMDGTVAGTPAYMSPEQANGDVSQLDARSDVFALGAMLYEVLTFTPPYQGKSVLETLRQARERRIEPPQARSRRLWRGKVPDPPRELAAVALHAMARRPADRYAGVEDLVADLRAWQAHEPVSVAADGFGARIAKWTRRHPTLAVGSLMAGVAVVIAAVLVALLQAESSRGELREARARIAEAEQAQTEALARQTKLEAEHAEAERQKLGAELDRRAQAERSLAIRELQSAWSEAQVHGMTHERFVQMLGADGIRARIADFENLIRTSELTGMPVTDQDLMWLGLLRLSGENDVEGAMREFDRLVQKTPDHMNAMLYRGVCQRLLHNLPAALADMNAARQALGRDHPALNYNRGLVHGELGNLAAAEDDFPAAIALRPDWVDPYISRCGIRSERGNFEGARADAEAAVQLGPDIAEAWYQRGATRKRDRNVAGALADFQQAVNLKPEFGMALARLGDMQMESGDGEAALRSFDAALRTGYQDASVFNNRGSILLSKKQFAEAIKSLTSGIALDETRPELWFLRAEATRQSGDPAGSLADYERAIRLDAENFRYWFAQGMAQDAAGSRAEAIRSLQNAYTLCPPGDNRDRLAQWIRQLGGEVPR